MKTKPLFISLTLGLGLALALLWLLGRLPQVVHAASYTVCPSGPPTCDYATIQAAVDAASDGDVIKIATGTYTGVSARVGVTQVVYISKSVTIRGGYTTAFTDPPDPEANPTTLDAQGQGRVLYISGDINPTIEGLRITGGDADELGGGPWSSADAGGGVYVITATATIRDNQVFNNTAYHGGGLYLYYSDATLSGNTVTSNTADSGGGGLYLWDSDATLSGNTVTSNTADYGGGGLYLWDSDATLSGNTVTSNTADYDGGGLYLWDSDATLSGNTVTSNTACDDGGGLYLYHDGSPATLSGNTIAFNTANSNGGGLYLNDTHFTICGNTITFGTAEGSGGGLSPSSSGAMLVNNLVADNRADGLGSGLYIVGSSPPVLHTTIARNTGGDGSGIYVTGWWGCAVPLPYFPGTVTLTNAILVSQTVGIAVTAGDTATLESTLWHGNITNWGGAGTINRSNDYTGPPAFVDPDAGDYHIGPSSAAIDVGVDAGITVDIDGEPRPVGAGYDIGADEYKGGDKVYLPIVMKGYCSCGPDNYEPNGSFAQAYGPLISGQTYPSYISCCDVASQRDYFYIDISTTNPIKVDLTNIPAGVDYDLYLYHSAQAEVGRSQNDDNAPEHISHTPVGAGRYYILVFSPYAHYSASPYWLRVTYD